MTSILFVDDEPQVLHGIRRGLRHRRHQWTMQFAPGGCAALDLLRSVPIDIVVTDIRMPGMSGTCLLRQIQHEHPTVIRLALSGQIERRDLARVAVHTHRLLPKPCHTQLLETHIREILGTTRWRHRGDNSCATATVHLAPTPSLYEELLNLLVDPDFCLIDVARVMERDCAMTARAMQIANSGFFGSPGTIYDVRSAVDRLGHSFVRDLILEAGLFEQVAMPRVRGFSLETLQVHSLAVARIARELLVESCEQKIAFTIGVVHELGRVVLAQLDPSGSERMLRQVGAATSPFEAERAVCATTPNEVGAIVLHNMGVPRPIVEAVAGIHRLQTGPYKGVPGPALAVRIARTWLEDRSAGGALAKSVGLNASALAGLEPFARVHPG